MIGYTSIIYTFTKELACCRLSNHIFNEKAANWVPEALKFKMRAALARACQNTHLGEHTLERGCPSHERPRLSPNAPFPVSLLTPPAPSPTIISRRDQAARWSCHGLRCWTVWALCHRRCWPGRACTEGHSGRTGPWEGGIQPRSTDTTLPCRAGSQSGPVRNCVGDSARMPSHWAAAGAGRISLHQKGHPR